MHIAERFKGTLQGNIFPGQLWSDRNLNKSMTMNNDEIPSLFPGDVNMPQVMYQSLLLMKKLYKTRILHLPTAKKVCRQQTSTCKALDILIRAYGMRAINFDKALFHLNILRQRYLASIPRPSTCKGCFIYDFQALLSPGNVCKNCKRTIYLFILITTQAKSVDARNALRETWLQYAEQNCGRIRYAFLIGGGCSLDLMNQVKEENRKYGDILVEDYIDSYYNLSYKVYGGLRWAVRHCPQAKFVSRSADDIYLNVPKILDYLMVNEWNMEDTVIGTCYSEASVDRKKWSKHYQSKNDYVPQKYGPFCMGTTIIMPIAATKKIVQVGPDIPWFNLEDQWLGFAGVKARLKLRSVIGFNIDYYRHEKTALHLGWSKKKRVCSFYEYWYNLHRTRPSDIRAIYHHCIKNTSRN